MCKAGDARKQRFAGATDRELVGLARTDACTQNARIVEPQAGVLNTGRGRATWGATRSVTEVCLRLGAWGALQANPKKWGAKDRNLFGLEAF